MIGISWLLIYRHEEYKTLIKNIEGLQKKVDKQKDLQIFQGAASKNKTQDKKLQISEQQLKQYHADLTKVGRESDDDMYIVTDDGDILCGAVHDDIHESPLERLLGKNILCHVFRAWWWPSCPSSRYPS